LEGKIVLDTNNYMPIRDGRYPVIDSREKTEHELRQEQLPTSKVAKAFTHIQAPRLLISGRPAGAPDRQALSVSSDFPEAVALVTRLYDQFGFDTVDNSPLSESWRSGPGQPAWTALSHQTKAELTANLARARQTIPAKQRTRRYPRPHAGIRRVMPGAIVPRSRSWRTGGLGVCDAGRGVGAIAGASHGAREDLMFRACSPRGTRRCSPRPSARDPTQGCSRCRRAGG
jgi:hypothetical protein